MTNFPTDKILVLDIETNSTNIEDAKLRYFGAYSYLSGKRYYLKGDSAGTIEAIKEIIDAHDVIVTFNGKKFDLPILNRYGIMFMYKTQIDLWEILSPPKLDLRTRERTGGKGRGSFMGLNLDSWSLANIVKALELGEYKEEGFDYNILKKEPKEWTEEEIKLIVEYLTQDITVTKRLFEYTNNFYYPLTEHMSEYNINKFHYITASVASMAYKIICHEAGLEETYGEGERFKYSGGYVKEPVMEEYVGEVICFDFNSLYPSIFRGFNLFSPISNEEYDEMINEMDDPPVFTGNDFFEIKGKYLVDEPGIIEKVIAKLYSLRKIYKKSGDHREYLIKIIINSLYGITAHPAFYHVFSRFGGRDCTAIGRKMTQYAGETFDQKGFITLYSDTDSCYVALNGKSREEAIQVAKEIESFLLSKMPLPHSDFGLGIDAEIDAIFFFKDETGHFKKKNYIYITKEGKLKFKGLPIIKSNASKLAVYILDKFLKDQILNTKSVKFPREYIKQLIYTALENDLSLATQTYKVRDYDFYENNPNGLHAQISKTYGSGTINLIPNSVFGVGKAKHYCKIEEFKENKLNLSDIDLSVAWNNLDPFIKQEQTFLNEYFDFDLNSDYDEAMDE